MYRHKPLSLYLQLQLQLLLTVLNGLKLNSLQSSLPYFSLNSMNKVFSIQFPAFPHLMPGE